MKRLILLLIVLKFNTIIAQEKYNVVIPSKVVFTEDFSANTKNWLTVVNDSVGLKIADGKYYTMAAKSNLVLPKGVDVSLSGKKSLWRLSTETEYIEGGSFFGLLFGGLASRPTYAFLINGNSDYVVLKIVDGKSDVLLKGNSSKINKGQNAKNILTVYNGYNFLNVEPYLNFYVNGSNVRKATKTEQAKIDLANEELRKKNGGSMPFSASDFADIGKEYIPLHEPGNGKIGLMATKGVVVNFDNLKLEAKESKGNLIMRGNEWENDPQLTKYLSKQLLAEDIKEADEYKESKQKSTIEKIKRANEGISKLSEGLLYPFGKTVKAAVAEVKAVTWLNQFLTSLTSSISSPLNFYADKDLISKTDTNEFYAVRHFLPGVASEAKVLVTKTKGKQNFKAILQLGTNLTEAKATELCSNYLANIAAAFDHYGNKYIDLNEGEKATMIPRQIFINDGGNFISKKVTIATLLPVKVNGGWNVFLNIFQ